MNRREIKFRIWDNLKKTYLKNIRVHPIRIDDNVSGFIQHPEGHTIEQYTGLRVKNKEIIQDIYEGDIVETIHGSRGVVIYYLGQYDKPTSGYGSIASFIIDETKNGFASMRNIGTVSKVLGNIHENPDLLK